YRSAHRSWTRSLGPHRNRRCGHRQPVPRWWWTTRNTVCSEDHFLVSTDFSSPAPLANMREKHLCKSSFSRILSDFRVPSKLEYTSTTYDRESYIERAAFRSACAGSRPG